MQVVVCKEAPKAIGPYSQAIICGPTMFVSGQIALDPVTGQMVNDTLENEINRVLDNCEAILLEARYGFQNVVKATIFCTDMADFDLINKLYAERFKFSIPPARSCVQVAALPKGARVEIEVIARK